MLSQPATELIKEISVLELEVGHVEQYLVSLYQQAFDQQVTSTSPSTKERGPKSPKTSAKEKSELWSGVGIMSNVEKPSLRSTCINPQKDLNDLGGEDRLVESDIYCKLADPPLLDHGLSSPTSSSSSMSAFSPKDHTGMWSPGLKKYSSLDERLDNPFHVQGLKEFSGPYSTMVEVQYIYRNDKKLDEVEHMLQNFRFLISRLEEIDPKKMTHSEKLAFWINVHNALMMHWLRLLLSSKSKFKSGDERQAYSIEHPEPLLHFVLCSGSHSDPAVRFYTPKSIAKELEAAKDEYIRATFGVSKDHKIVLPKIVESFAKDSDLCTTGSVEMIQKSLPQSVPKSIKKCQL
ncbi:uncharacterized protein LOC108197953 [Daucus carota subsp. sativus]|uniref:uncharacterized protein LOC108197953 n=1 Tax=Daucus carota subsp. sativus TaxID=79200 RepID=UPI0030839FE3